MAPEKPAYYYNMNGYLLDTNILIYYLQGNNRVIEYLNDLCQDNFSISIVSRLELLVGHSKNERTIDEMEMVIDECKNISLDKKIVKEAAILNATSRSKLKFKDLIIAATAKTHGFVLVTSDKDFKKISGLKIELLIP